MLGDARTWKRDWFLVAALLCSICSGARGATTQNPGKISLIADFQRFGLPPLVQGNRGTCSLIAITTLAEFERDRQVTDGRRELSVEYLIWTTNRATGKTGDSAMFFAAVHGLNTLGVCSSDRMPYMDKPDPGREPSSKALADSVSLRQRWQVEWIKRSSAGSPVTDGELAEMKHALAAGHPVACGLQWPKTLRGSDILDVLPENLLFNGHSIVFAGYADDARKPGGGTFIFRNCGGPGWGNGGYGEISYAYVRAYANDALWLRYGAPDSEMPLHRFEAESMPILARENCAAVVQPMDSWGGLMWSGGRQLYCRGPKGGRVDLGFEIHSGGSFRMRVLATAAPDYGVIGAALDGRTLPCECDLYADPVCPAGSFELGNVYLTAGEHRISIMAVDKNTHAENYNFGLDAVDLLKATNAS